MSEFKTLFREEELSWIIALNVEYQYPGINTDDYRSNEFTESQKVETSTFVIGCTKLN